MIRVVATFIIDPEKVDQVIEIARELIEITREEKGCVHYDLVQCVDQANQLTILEAWETQEELDVHSASDHFARLVPQIADACLEPPAIVANIQII